MSSTILLQTFFLPLLFLGVCGFVLTTFLLRKYLAKRKIQDQYPSFKQIFHDGLISFFSPLFFYPSSVFFAYCVYYHHGLVYTDIHKYGIPYFIFSFILATFVHDFYYYWLHRFLHLRFMFKKIHYIHHSTRNPTAVTFLTLHPLETIMTSLSTPIIIFLFPMSATALVMLYMYNLMHAAYAHNGFEWFPGKISRRWLNNAVAHNIHHKNVDVNFSYYYLIWDRVFGTLDKTYYPTFDKIAQQIKA